METKFYASAAIKKINFRVTRNLKKPVHVPARVHMRVFDF